MKIAYIVPSLRNVGPVIVVKELVEQMVKNGHQCHIFYFDEQVELKFPCPTSKISFLHGIDFCSFDIVHTHCLRPDAYVCFHKPLCGKTKFITTLHNYIFRDLFYQYNRLITYCCGYTWMKLFLMRHDCIVALSKDAVDYYKRWIKPSRLTWAYNTRSLLMQDELAGEEKKSLLEFKRESILIGVNALLTERKGIDMIICALAKLPKYKLFIVGDGKVKSDLMQLAQKQSVDDRVYFAGYHKNAYRYLSYYDIYAIPSRSEGFPLALLEASIVGVPTVCSDIPVFKELYSEQEVSFFEIENIESLITAILRVTNNTSYSIAIREKYRSKYSPEKFYQRYVDIYKSL